MAKLCFHPFEHFILSGSRDFTLKLCDYSLALRDEVAAKSQSKAARVMGVESSPVTTCCFHPSGDFALVGTEQNFVRLYDVQTFSAYVASDQVMNFHKGRISSVRFEPTRGSSYATAGSDGSVRLWDGISQELIRVLKDVHSGTPVTSVEYSPSGKYLLTTGCDSTSRLFDVGSGKEVAVYRGARQQLQHLRATFDYSGDFVLKGDEHRFGVCAWDTRTTELVKRITVKGLVRAIAASPTEPTFMTAGQDAKAKLFSVV